MLRGRLRIACLLSLPVLLTAQDTDPFRELRFRLIGPFRGGRSEYDINTAYLNAVHETENELPPVVP